MSDPRLVRWQTITLSTLFVGYAGYYVCRSNLSVATPLLLEEFGSQGITKVEIGAIQSAGVALYALGKITNGVLADFLGGRRLFLIGMVASVLCTIVFGLAAGMLVFGLSWAANRYFQSMGWVSLVKVASRWYPVRRHATIMGILSMSFLIGDAFARWFLGETMARGVGWRGVFFVSAATLAVISIASFFTLKAGPRDVGLPELAANPTNVFGIDGERERPPSIGELLRPLVRSRIFWLICLVNFGLTMIRESFQTWTPTWLHEVVGSTPADAAKSSVVFQLCGGLSALAAGLLSDRLGGRHGRVLVPSMLLLVGALVLISAVPVDGNLALALVLVSAVAVFLLAPYSLLSGVMALDIGGKQGASTTAGVIDSAGYVGGMVAGIGVGAIAQQLGWQAAFLFLAIVAALTVVAGIAYWILHERRYVDARTPP